MGGIGSGKSTVAAEFAKLGCKVTDADRIVHKLYDQPAVKEKIVCLFGVSILDQDGKIDRKKLAELVFADREKLMSLDSIIHPPVLAQIKQLIEQYSSQPNVRAIVLDIPLLAETGLDKLCDRLIFVDCNQGLRMQRAKNRGSSIAEEAHLKTRENFQISLDTKRKLADNVIDNNSCFSSLVKQVSSIFSIITNNGQVGL